MTATRRRPGASSRGGAGRTLAVFAFDRPVGFPGGTTLTVELDQSHGGVHLIGRFRLAWKAKDRLLARPTARCPATWPQSSRSRRRGAATHSGPSWPSGSGAGREYDRGPGAPAGDLARVYCGTSQFAADGSFRPAVTPRPVHVLERGDVTHPLAAAVPGAVVAVPGLKGRFPLANSDDEGQRRAALADWLADPANPLTWRVIVSRAWRYHFGKGIVDTPNDLGVMGGNPSHPELLDWMAADFRDGGGSLKRLHRLIVTSSTYRPGVRHDPAATAADADNRLLWRMNRGRLDAEAVRDAVLLVSGRLDETMYGPPVKHFLMKPALHVTPRAGLRAFRRGRPGGSAACSIYRYIFRTRPDPLLEVLDCPTTPRNPPRSAPGVGGGAPGAGAVEQQVHAAARRAPRRPGRGGGSPGRRAGGAARVPARVSLGARRTPPRRRLGWITAANTDWPTCVGCCSTVASFCSSIESPRRATRRFHDRSARHSCSAGLAGWPFRTCSPRPTSRARGRISTAGCTTGPRCGARRAGYSSAAA